MKPEKLMREPFYTLMYKASEGWNDHLWQVPPELLQKYSESIVMECSKIITHGGYWSGGLVGEKRQATPSEIAKMIRDHFKIEGEN
jgi:hypothetical protein